MFPLFKMFLHPLRIFWYFEGGVLFTRGFVESGLRPPGGSVAAAVLSDSFLSLTLFSDFFLSDHSVAAKSGGCFPGDASVTLEGGAHKPISDLRPGERVLASAGAGGDLVFSPVLTFLDRDPVTLRLFYTLQTDAGARLSLTAAHLLFVTEGNCSEGVELNHGALRTVYASDARPGQCVLVSQGGAGRLSHITAVSVTARRGAYAPLTEQGTLVVDGVVASCYAVLEQHAVAHRAFSPLRLLHSWTGFTGGGGDGVHWYARLLHWLGEMLLDSGRLHPMGAGSAGVPAEA